MNDIMFPRPKVSLEDRECRYMQRGAILWLTGLSGAGKTTISIEIEKVLFENKHLVYVLDGDHIRRGLNSDLGFSAEDRRENIRRIGEVAKLFGDSAYIVIVAFISPFRDDREKIKNSCQSVRFIEVFVDCPLEVCESRDTKGLYKKARRGEIPAFTGISSPYEPPLNPDIRIRTDKCNVKESVHLVLDYLNENKVVGLI